MKTLPKFTKICSENLTSQISIDEIINELYTIQDILRWTVSYFGAANIWYGHGTNNPWDEAIQLILPSLNLPLDIPEDIQTARLTCAERRHIIKRVIQRVEERIPVSYITNRSWFCDHEFYVDKRVLIPRSPIGELINNRFSNLIHREPRHILDMCTGSGCIAISCAYIFPKAEIDAVDISDDALEVAEINIEEHDMTNRVIPILSDLFCNIPKIKYDLIIANPPYVDREDIPNLPKEYQHESELGLVSNKNGLELISYILTYSLDYLTEDGILICEVGNNMVRLVRKYPNVPFTWIKLNNGGEGIFMLTKKQLVAVRKHFKFQ